MSPEKLAKLRTLFGRVDRDLNRLSGTDTFEAAIKKLRPLVADEGPAFAAWLHHRACREFPTSEPSTVDPNQFDAILRFMQNKEQFLAALVQFPDEAAPEIEKALLFIHRELLPATRDALKSTVKRLPHHPAGGRPRATEDPTKRTHICRDLAELDDKKVLRGVAQRRVAKRHSKSLREIQRIWRDCPQNR